MKRKTIIFSGLVLLALAFGALFLFASLNEASLDGVYYRQIEDGADGFSGLDKETILNLRDQQVTFYKEGLEEKGSIDRKAGSIRLGSKLYSYVHNGGFAHAQAQGGSDQFQGGPLSGQKRQPLSQEARAEV